MPFALNGFNIGQDLTVIFRCIETGRQFTADQLGHLMDLKFETEETEVTIKPITMGGRQLVDTIWHGGAGEVSFARANGTLTNVFVEMINNFFDNQQRYHWNIFITVANRDGSTDQYQLQNCAFSKANLGNFKSTAEVDQSFRFRAQNIKRLDGGGAALSGPSQF